MSATQICFAFGLCLALVGFAGPKLSRSGDIIADKTGLSGNWIGIILLATRAPHCTLISARNYPYPLNRAGCGSPVHSE